jgi:hypothetical protein
MSRFSDQEKAAILRESRRLLKDDDRPVPPVAREPLPEIVFEEPVAKWKREADEQEARFEAERAASQREERAEREALARARALDGVEERVTVLEQRMDEVERQISELSRAVGDFSDSVSEAMQHQDKQLEKLSVKLSEIRAADDLHRAALDLPNPLIRKERRIN